MLVKGATDNKDHGPTWGHLGHVGHRWVPCRPSSVGRDTIIFYACTMEVWHFSSYLTIKNYVNDDIRPHPTQFS